LSHALDVFGLDVAGLVCADFGCSTGGFTDCLLKRGAAHVYAIDTAYGVLDYTLRMDERVTVMERTNALHAQPAGEEGVDLVVIDAGWTVQAKMLPVALRWLRPDRASRAASRIITLIKPHYELAKLDADDLGFEASNAARGKQGSVLDEETAAAVLGAVLAQLPGLGVDVVDVARSPIRGGGSRSKRKDAGNIEYLALLRPATAM